MSHVTSIGVHVNPGEFPTSRVVDLGEPRSRRALVETGRSDSAQGEKKAAASLELLLPRLYDELRAAAHRQLARRRYGNRGTPTLNTTALVHEAYLRVADSSGHAWRDEAHFLSIAAVAMRHILIDTARARAAAKRGGHVDVRALTTDEDIIDERAERMIELDAALAELQSLSPRLCRVVELKYFGGLSEDRVAEILGVTPRTVQRDWAKARVLLREALDA